jgi:hypothetical protein
MNVKRSLKAALVAVLLPIGMLPAMPATGEGSALVVDVIRENFQRVGGNNTSSGGHIVFEGNRLYMGTYGTGMRWFDISDPKAPRLLGTYEPGTAASPRADAVPDAAVWDGRHIAVLNGTGRSTAPLASLNTQKAEFVDTTDPAKPVLLHTFTGPAQNNDAESHNGDFFDAKRYWLPSGGGSGSIKDAGLRIYDMQPTLDNPPDPTNTNPANDPVRLFPPDDCWTDVAILCDPVTLWRDSPHRGDQPVGPEPFSHTHDITIYPSYPVQQPDGTFANRDIILMAEGGNYTNNAGNTGSVFVVDITDPKKPVVLQRWLHQTGAGHHPIRYHHEAIFIEGQPNLMIVSDEDLHNGCGTAGGLTAVQLSPDLKSGTEMSEWFIPSGTPAAVCSAHVFSNAGNLLFMGAYNAGTLAIDYSDPAKPKKAGHFLKEGGNSWGAYYNPADGYVYQGDWTNGLDVLEFLGPIPGLPSGSVTRTCPGRASSPQPQLVGTSGNDVLVGSSQSEIICGVGGKDKIRGGGGRDIIIAGAGKDRVNGGGGKDLLKGQGGNDRLRGGSGRDKCVGGKGKDRGSKCEKGKL